MTDCIYISTSLIIHAVTIYGIVGVVTLIAIFQSPKFDQWIAKVIGAEKESVLAWIFSIALIGSLVAFVFGVATEVMAFADVIVGFVSNISQYLPCVVFVP